MPKLFEITIPSETNEGRRCDAAHTELAGYILATVGGYTELPEAKGHWVNAGKVYFELVRTYRVACTIPQWRGIVKKAFRTFPDQLAIFHAHVGTAVIEQRGSADDMQA